MPWIKTKRSEDPHTCDLPVTHENPTYTHGDVWECESCGKMYRATAVGNAVVLVKMGRVATMWFRFVQDVMNQ